METGVSHTLLDFFRTSEITLDRLDPEVAANLIAAASDIALVVDKEGIIQNVSLSSNNMPSGFPKEWLGKRWGEIVTVESRPKVEELLQGAASKAPPRWRQVNHPSPDGKDLPVNYSAIQLGDMGRIVAIGRELGAMSALQQRLISAQQSMEREYSRLRNAEMRYRLLFQITAEPVLAVDVGSRKVTEANPAALRLLGAKSRGTVGRPAMELFDGPSRDAVTRLLSLVETAGRQEETAARLSSDGPELIVSATLFRQDSASYFLLRITDPAHVGAMAGESSSIRLSKIVENIPDSFVVTDAGGQILSANIAFLDLVHASTVEQVLGMQLSQWLGRAGVDFPAMVETLKGQGSLRNLPTIVRSSFDLVEDVEVSAVVVMDGVRTCYGFIIRHIGLRQPTQNRDAADRLPRPIEQFTNLVGRVPLKEMVRETTDMIERLCIEAALELTDDNRASAAEMLGLSRQSLYSKLRRFGIVSDLDTEDGAPD
jgi:transcriptional regulator PpsR